MNGDRSLLVGLGTDSDKLDPNDREAVQAALDPILPGVDVLPAQVTPGCAVQACGVRDHLPNYAEAGAVVIGVSPDPVRAVKKFADMAAA
jgi:peroxiredoxin Q/BCP